MTIKKGEEAEKNLEILSEDASEYFRYLTTAYRSYSKQFTPFFTIFDGMWCHTIENLRLWVFYLKLFSLAITFVAVYTVFEISDLSIYLQLTIFVLVLTPIILYIRMLAIERMTTPGDGLFHLGTFEKFRKREYEAFCRLIQNDFNPSRFKEDLKIPKLDEVVIGIFKQIKEGLIIDKSELKEEKNKLQDEVNELKRYLKENLDYNKDIQKDLKETRDDLNHYKMSLEKMTNMIDHIRSSFRAIADSGFDSFALNGLPSNYPYLVYELNDKMNEFTLVNYGELNPHEFQGKIRIEEMDNEVVLAFKNREEEYKGKSSYLKHIPLLKERHIVVKLQLDQKTIESLNDDLHSEHKMSKISITTTFKQFWICWFVFLTYQHLIENSLSKKLKEKGVEEGA
ncbi:hypothetical protein CR203_21710 [Salipaludibacillus neizhouensis]|uniref:Uncharacterized protein n=1 Tax=Salipaludibacillus neizhouensis TaxID=885475 RepID=A0A3A9K313_9BACI|nr:hypothetical protein [Salipaludibacillus neizhouensis]RKL65290.1 hypothetical protein CR203_21710 [Salipaludibacillus neizhouensis]